MRAIPIAVAFLFFTVAAFADCKSTYKTCLAAAKSARARNKCEVAFRTCQVPEPGGSNVRGTSGKNGGSGTGPRLYLRKPPSTRDCVGPDGGTRQYDPKRECCTASGVVTFDPAKECCADGTLRKNPAVKVAFIESDCPPPNRVPSSKVPSANGCGSGWNEILVPDNPSDVLSGIDTVRILAGKCSVSFTPACDIHDQCWGFCGNGKTDCDGDFHANLLALCSKAQSETCRLECTYLADAYTAAVASFGSQAYYDAQTEGCECCV